MPHRGYENRQGIHRANADACGIATDGGMDVSMVQESAVAASGNDRAEPGHERRRCAGVDGIPDVAERWREIWRCRESTAAGSIQGGRETMNRHLTIGVVFAAAVLATSCSRKTESVALPKPTAFGAAIVESSGGKQIAQTGSLLPQPLVVQVNDEQGTAVAGALVQFAAAPGVTFDPAFGLTDSSGQVTTNVSLGGMAGRYQLTASTFDKSHKNVELKIEENALGYQQALGRRLNDQYCERCHNAES